MAKIIEGLDDSAKQDFKLTLEDGVTLECSLVFMPTQNNWFLTFKYKDRSVNNIRITNSPNFIRELKNLVPFGLGCSANNKIDPCSQDDFLTQRCRLFLLEGIVELEQMEALYED